MCTIFSGHISCKKGKDWGKVYFISGIHHEKDRRQIKHERLIAWETEGYTLDQFRVSHDCGSDVKEDEKKELMKLLRIWGKKQNTYRLFLDRFLSVTQHGKKLDESKFTLDLKHRTFSTKENNLVIDASLLNGFTFNTYSNCTFNTGYNCEMNLK